MKLIDTQASNSPIADNPIEAKGKGEITPFQSCGFTFDSLAAFLHLDAFPMVRL